jgi:hypothetical protein
MNRRKRGRAKKERYMAEIVFVWIHSKNGSLTGWLLAGLFSTGFTG